jgi:hypothetical protein
MGAHVPDASQEGDVETACRLLQPELLQAVEEVDETGTNSAHVHVHRKAEAGVHRH